MPHLHYITVREPSNPAEPRHLGYYEWGDTANSNVVVCVHGLSRNARDFEALAVALAPRYRVLCVDMAGRGNSNWLANKNDYTYPLYVGDCLVFLQHLQLKNVTWVGTSMGGIIGMMIAAQQQGHIARMVLGDIGSVVSATGLKRILGYVGKESVFANATDAMAHLRTILATWGVTSDAHWEALFMSSFIPLPDGSYAFAYDPDISKPFRDSASKDGTVTDIDLSAFWNAITCPALILRGAESDILSHETAQTMCQRTAPTCLIELPHVGHAPSLQEEYQIKAIAEWLDNGL